MKCKFCLPVITATVLFLASCNNKKSSSDNTAIKVNGKEAYSDTSSSFVKVYDENGRLCIQQSNTYYELVDLYEGQARIPLLLKINKVELCVADSVNKHKVFKISAKSVMDTKDVHWETEFVATDLQFKDNTLVATHEGVENEEDYIKRFSLRDGREVFACSYGDMKVAIPNVRDKRFTGFTSQRAATGPVQEKREENLIGLIRYASSDKSISTLKVKLKRSPLAGKIPDYTPEMQLTPANANTSSIEDGKGIILMKADENYTPADVKDFVIQFTFYIGDDNEATQITIPVVNDIPDVAHATYDHEVFEITAE
jgi:hypothetical protein